MISVCVCSLIYSSSFGWRPDGGHFRRASVLVSCGLHDLSECQLRADAHILPGVSFLTLAGIVTTVSIASDSNVRKRSLLGFHSNSDVWFIHNVYTQLKRFLYHRVSNLFS